jgi:hypothetical protein
MSQHLIRRRSTQLDLYRPRPKIPTWRTLPAELKQRVIPLLAQLLRDHLAGRLEVRSGKEASDE